MTGHQVSRSAVKADARQRSIRTFLQGLAIDVGVAVVLVLGTAVLPGVEWTREYWVALGLSLGRTVIQTAVAYAMRILVPPTKVTARK